MYFTDEVGNGLQGLLLSHYKPDLVALLVSEQLGIPGPSLLPLLIAESVELASHLEYALLTFLAGNFLHLGEINLSNDC